MLLSPSLERNFDLKRPQKPAFSVGGGCVGAEEEGAGAEREPVAGGVVFRVSVTIFRTSAGSSREFRMVLELREGWERVSDGGFQSGLVAEATMRRISSRRDSSTGMMRVDVPRGAEPRLAEGEMRELEGSCCP